MWFYVSVLLYILGAALVWFSLEFEVEDVSPAKKWLITIGWPFMVLISLAVLAWEIFDDWLDDPY
jgi:hypothetical protein